MKDKKIQVRVNDFERFCIYTYAKELGMTVSDYLSAKALSGLDLEEYAKKWIEFEKNRQ